MSERAVSERDSGGAIAGFVIAAVVVILALPSGVLAFATDFEAAKKPVSQSEPAGAFRTDGEGPRLARGRSLLWNARAPQYPFTFARNPNRPDRSVTVAVRLSPEALRTFNTAPPRREAGQGSGLGLGLGQSAFNLGVARGYRNFAQELTGSAHRIEGADANRFSLSSGARRDEPPDIPRNLYEPGGGARSFSADANAPVNLRGALKVTRNLNVTAGVRYAPDNERLPPPTDGKRDNQAVYVGTQLKF